MEKIAVGDFQKYDFAVEKASLIAEMICRYAEIENLYRKFPSRARDELDQALSHLYTSIMAYLARTRAYFRQNTLSTYPRLAQKLQLTSNERSERTLSSALISTSDLERAFDAILTAERNVSRCSFLVDRQGKFAYISYDLITNAS